MSHLKIESSPNLALNRLQLDTSNYRDSGRADAAMITASVSWLNRELDAG